VIKGAVDDGVEAVFESFEPGGVGDLEIDVDPRPLGVAFRQLDRRRGIVDAGGRIAVCRIVNRVMTGARAGVEHLAADPAVGHQLLHCGLRAADVPGDPPVGVFRRVVQRLETGNVRVSHWLSLTTNAAVHPRSRLRNAGRGRGSARWRRR
jgi:hypothetical protein